MNLEFGLISIIAFFIILTPIVFVHELGHFWFARIFNVNVEVFSIGFGPVLFSFLDRKGTKWQLASIPIGGFVKMQGELNINPDTNKKDGRCTHCGCFMNVKVHYATAECPIGKWAEECDHETKCGCK